MAVVKYKERILYMQNKKPLFYLIVAALLALAIKYSSSIFDSASLILSVLMPLIIGCIIAYILNILVVKIESLPIFKNTSSPVYKARRAISILASLLIIALVIVLLVKTIIPQLGSALSLIISEIPPAISRFIDWIHSKNVEIPQLEEWLASLDINWQKISSYIISGANSLFTSAFSLLSSFGGIVVNLVIALIFALYILAGKERLARQFKSLADVYLKDKARGRLMYFLATAHDTFTKFIVGQFTEAIILGVLCIVGMWIFRFPYAAMIGTLIGATALLPIVGAYIGAFVGFFMIVTVSPIKAFAFIFFIVILQQLEGNLIYPRVVGSSIGLPGIWVLAAVTVGGGLWGIGGMLIAVPTAATIYKLIKKDVDKKQTAALSVPSNNE